MRSATTGVEPPRLNLVSYIDDLPRRAGRQAYMWREGARWRSRTYADLHRRVLACAATLTAAGVGPGDPVIIQGPESADWVEALLGTFKAGAVAVPLDASTGAPFRARVAGKVEGRVFLGPPGVESPPGVRRIDFGSWGASSPPAGPAPDPEPGARAEIIFTSGTTGEPKGVVLTHHNLVSDLAPIERAFRKYEPYVRRAGRLRFLSTLPLSHMFGQVLSVFLSLVMGFTVVFVAPRPRDVLDAASRMKAWGLFTVPRLLDLLAAETRRIVRNEGWLDAFEARQRRLERWPFYLQAPAFWRVQRLFGWRFRLFVVGGAPLSEALQRFWEHTGYLVVQGYGLTETAPVVSISNPFDRRAGNVGRPMHFQEVKLGPGNEVWIRGPNVTPGYLGETGSPADEGWFHTGDVGEFDAQGRLRIRGRLKEVIVTPEGENVHPVDVEAAFAGITGVREVCVIAVPSGGGDHVHAVLLLEPGVDPMPVLQQANERLMPKQRVRGHSVWTEPDFPRTSTGKVRKAALRDRLLARQGEEAPAAAAPADAAEGVRRLVARMARVPAENVRETTRLVEGLGLGSLDLVELTVAIEEEFGASLVEESLAQATVEDLQRAVLAASLRPEATPRRAGAEAPPPDSAATPTPQPVSTADFGLRDGGTRGALRMPRWARRAPVHFLRRLIEEILYVPFIHIFARPEVRGLEHLSEARPPYLFVANHLGYVDSGLFKTLLPRRLRGRIAPAMTTRYHRAFFGEIRSGPGRYVKEWLQVRLVQFLFHAWPLPETAGFRASLSYAGELADEGFSLLIYPEGRHVPGADIETFRGGIGIFARELRAAVVPAYVEGTDRVFPDDAWWPRIGRTRLVIGRPLRIDPETEAGEVTRRLEAAVRGLATEVKG